MDGGRRLTGSAGWPQWSFLGSLPQSALAALFAVGTQREFAAGSTLLMEGDSGTDVIIMIDGWAKVVGLTAYGGRALLALCFSGDLVGEQAALEDRPRTASVVAAGPTVVLVVGRDSFLNFLIDAPAAGLALSRVLSAKLRWATSRRIDFSGLPVLARLARVLSELAQLECAPAGWGVSFGYTLTQPELAEMIGASEPSVHKALRQLRDRGVIETGYRKIVIRDPAALRVVAESAWPELARLSSTTQVAS
jgi:CRP-like cAMP-binding protein